MRLTALEFGLTQFEQRLLDCELLLEVGQQVCHLAIIVIILNAAKRREVKTLSASVYKQKAQELIFHSIFKPSLEKVI